MMHSNGAEHRKKRLCRKYLCIMFTDNHNAGRLVDFIVGWHKHATLRRKGEAGLWSAYSRADLLAGAGLTLKQYRSAKPLLEGAVRFRGGGYRGKRAIFAQPTALLVRFLAGEYPTRRAARKALAGLRQAPSKQDLSQNFKHAPQAPVGTAQGTFQGPTRGPIRYFYPLHSSYA